MAREVFMAGECPGEMVVSKEPEFTFQNPWWYSPVIPALENPRQADHP